MSHYKKYAMGMMDWDEFLFACYEEERYREKMAEDRELRKEQRMNELNGYWIDLVNAGIATEEELQLVTSINGYTEETLDDVLYVRTGYRNWEQYVEEEVE